MTTQTPALTLRGVTKRYGALTAVDDVSLEVAKGAATPSSAPTARASPRSSTSSPAGCR